MSALALRTDRVMGDWPGALMTLGGLVAVFVAFFHGDIVDLVHVWWKSQAYNHCLLLPPIIGWLVWHRRAALARLDPRCWWPGLAWLALGALLWLTGAAAGVALFRHAGLVVMGQGLVVAMLGPGVARALAFPLFYALFLIPVGTEAEPLLQIVTARMAMALLALAGVPAQIEGIFISVPGGLFRVAQACSGTGFLIAMAAYTALAANLCFRNPVRRAVFVVAALLTCFIANAIRAFGIIYVAYRTSLNSAIVVDHIVYGWLFFAGVIVLVMWVARRWFDRDPFDPPRPERERVGSRHTSRRWPVLVAALAIMGAPLLWSAGAGAFSLPLPPKTVLPDVPGWTRVADPAHTPWRPRFTGADRMVMGHYRDGAGGIVDLALVLYAHQRQGKELVGFGQGAAAPDGAGPWTWAAPAAAPPGARGDLLAGPHGQWLRTLTFYQLGDTQTGRAGEVKLATLKARLLGQDQRAMAIVLGTPVPPGADGQRRAQVALSDFLRAMGDVRGLAEHSLGRR